MSAKSLQVPPMLLAALSSIAPLYGQGPGPILVVNSLSGIPNGGLVQIGDGSLWGVTGGPLGVGQGSKVFRISPSGQFSTVFTFPPDGSKGANPNALFQATDGNFYGTTQNGDTARRNGTVFRFSAQGHAILKVFSGADGASPAGRLVQGAGSLFYGATTNGGASGKGVIFSLDTLGRFAVVYSFSGPDGAAPNGNLVYAPDGNLYGTTLNGGPDDVGTIFRLTPAGQLTTLHTFSVQGHGCPSSLALGADGVLYGATQEIYFGAASCAVFPNVAGSIFRFGPAGYQQLVELDLNNPNGPAFPAGPVVQGGDGNWYGTAAIGGPAFPPTGGVFQWTGGPAVLPAFFGGNRAGGNPCCELLASAGGAIWGVTQGISTEFGNNDAVVYRFGALLPKPAPVISAFNPQAGRAGALVRLFGDHFLGTAAVSFNGKPASLFSVPASGSLLVLVPAGATSGPIRVTNGGGTSVSTASFTILP